MALCGTHTHIYIHTLINAYTHTHTYSHTGACAKEEISREAMELCGTHVHTHTLTCAYTHIHIYIHMHIHIHLKDSCAKEEIS